MSLEEDDLIMQEYQNRRLLRMVAIVFIVVATLVVLGTLWMGQSARNATDEAVHSVSQFYLEELATRRAQVVSTNLETNLSNMQTAIDLMDTDDFSNMDHLRSYQSRMRQLYGLDKFAFVNEDGLIYTADGTRKDIDKYGINYKTISEPLINAITDDGEKKVIIAIALKGKSFQGKKLKAAFMEISMSEMLKGFSMQSGANDVTFCNIYTEDGVSLTDMILGGLASEDNLLEALDHADFDEGKTFEELKHDFTEMRAGVATFTYNGIYETLDYVPISGTDWMLTYLIRESVISDRISDISDGVTRRSFIQTILIALVLLVIFLFMMIQFRRSARLEMEKEAFEAEARIKQDEMQQRLELQEKLLAQEKQRVQQDKMITAMASDYRSVFYVDLDSGEGVCYRSNDDIADIETDSEKKFNFPAAFKDYAEKYVAEKDRQGFLAFIEPDEIKKALEGEAVIAHRYLTVRDGVESYEMLRMAGVRHPKDRDDGIVHAVGVGFTNVDSETRETMSRSQALSDALTLAEEASKAKTAFLSNMSHEIRTPMNAIIGLDTIALADPELPEKTREYLTKIDGSAHHLLRLINDILDVSRIESGKLTIKNEEFSFSQLIEQINAMISSQCQEKGLEYECHINGHVDDHYIGDDMKLKQVLINILGNSVKFTNAGGSVSMSVERIAHFDDKSTIRFILSDTGIGMDKDFLPKLFDKFSQEDQSATSRYGSTGLGMAISKSIVEMMNGNIEVESEKGKGTTFTVTVTLTDCEEAKCKGDIENADFDPAKLAVLVVDDDQVACEHAKLVLEGVGVTAETVMSGKEAIEMVKIREARREPYDLILVDWKMPDMDGLETTRQIRSIIGNESAIIILTAYNWDEILDEAVSAGVDSFIAKPLFAGDVLERFKEALLEKNARYPDREHKADLKGRRILLAEDMMVNAEIMKELLRMKDMLCEHAENGKIAVDMFSSHEEGYYDAILMDMRMPEMDGLEATMAIRALDRDDAKKIPIIALTANAFDEDVQKSLQAGLNAHLSKPVEPENLFSALEGLIKD